MDRYIPLMPTETRDLFERYIAAPETLTKSDQQQLRDYILKYGRVKVLNAVAASRSHHLDALTKRSR